MKKYIALITAICSTFCYSMEKEAKQNRFSITTYGTTITLLKGLISQANVDLTIVGKNQQKALKNPANDDPLLLLEKVKYQFDSINYCIYEKQQEHDSGSEDDTYIPYNHLIKDKLYQKATKKVIDHPVMLIHEPRIVQFQYYDPLSQQQIIGHAYHQNKKQIAASDDTPEIQVKTALEHLTLCYRTALFNSLLKLKNNTTKSIALPTLGADVGLSRDKAALIAIATILQFIKNNPYKFSHMYLYVKKWSDYKRYEDLLIEHYLVIHRALLIYHGCLITHPFKLLPEEVQKNILLLLIATLPESNQRLSV